jgi:hypothetical protein
MPRVKATKLPPIPESEVQANGIAVLESLGCIAHRRNTGAMTLPATDRWARRFIKFSEKGAADVWIVLPSGAHGECEIKRPGGRPTLDQVLWLMRHNGHGSAVAWWSDSVESVERVARHVIAGGGSGSRKRPTHTRSRSRGRR